MHADLYGRITQQIIAAIADGALTYRMPWHCQPGIGTLTNAVTGRAYRGINTLLLWAEATRAEYTSGRWATYRQWAQSGGQVRAGERATLVLLWKQLNSNVSDIADRDPSIPDRRTLARAFHVFNADQVEGAVSPAIDALAPSTRNEGADAFFARQPAELWHGSDRAFYDPNTDLISMPSFDAFVSAESYYSVLSHELTHWTGDKTRLDRDLSGRFGSEAYAMEELVAELGAAFTIGHLGLACEPRTDHAPYIASWLRVLGQDPRAIVTAASKAQAAADYLVGLADAKNAAEVEGIYVKGVAADHAQVGAVA